MTRKQFQDAGLASALRSVLDSDVFGEAESVIKEENAPVFRPGLDPVEESRMHSYEAGIHAAFAGLRSLTTPHLDPTTEPPDAPWDYLTKPPEESPESD